MYKVVQVLVRFNQKSKQGNDNIYVKKKQKQKTKNKKKTHTHTHFVSFHFKNHASGQLMGTVGV